MNRHRSDYKLLRTSWRYQTREYFDNSTLHGVRYIAEKDRPFRERLMWFCFTTAGAVATMIIISSLWEKFQTNPTITGLDTDFHSWEVPFPTVTICNTQPVDPELVDTIIEELGINSSSEQYTYYKSFYNTIGSLSMSNIEQIENFTTDPELPQSDFRTIVLNVVYHCENSFESCIWKARDFDCCQGFLPIFTENGFCYIFNSPHSLKSWPWLNRTLPPYYQHHIHETDPKWSIKYGNKHVLKNAQKMYLHSEDQIPGYDMLPHFVWLGRVESLLFSVKHTYTTQDASQLSIRQRKCTFPNEIHLKLSDTYNYYTCTAQCRMEAAKQLCGCVPFFYPEIATFKYCTLQEFQCIVNNKKKITQPINCNCELSCFNTVYEVEKFKEVDPQTMAKNDMKIELEFVSWPMVRYKREVIFGWVDLLVAFGGIAGLFLGFSLLSGVEIIYYFTIRACCMVYREKETLRKLQRDYEKRQIPNYDLSLTPYFIKPPEPGGGIRTLQTTNGIFINTQVRPAYLVPPGPPPYKGRRQAWEAVSPFGIQFLP